MIKRIILVLVCATVGLLILAACSEAQTTMIQTMVANPADGQAMATTTTPIAFSMLATPTLDPIANGPMGTFTAIAKTIEPPTPDPNQYEIVLRGNPHFIEFHAWW